MPRYRAVVIVSGLVVVGMFAPNSEAQFYQELSRGLSRLSAPAAPSAQRFGQFRISPDSFSDGWRFDFSRSFGPDAFGRPNRIDLGPLDVTFNSGALRMQGQYSRRGIPSVEFSAFTPAPIDYSVTFNSGFQDVEINNAQLGYTTVWNVNQLGFYDYALDVTHRGEFEVDGMVLADRGTLDFDIGPINMSGHVLGDALAALTVPLFEGAGMDNPFAIFSGRATKRIEVEQTRDELTGRALAGEILSEEEMGELVTASLVAAALDGAVPDFSFLAEEAFAPTLEAIGADLTLDDAEGSFAPAIPDNGLLVPEPATATLLLLAAAVLWVTRRPRWSSRAAAD